MAFGIVSVPGALLASRRSMPCLEFNGAQFLGMQGRPGRCIAFTFEEKVPDDDGQLARISLWAPPTQ